MSKRTPYTQATDPDGVETGEDWTDVSSDSTSELWGRANERVTNIGGTATAITGDIAFDTTQFTYVEGKRLWFVADSDSAGATTINVEGLGAIAIKDHKGDAITATTWEAGDVVAGTVVSNELRLDAGLLPPPEPAIGAVKKIWPVFKTTSLSATGEFVSITNLAGEIGDILVLPKFTFGDLEDNAGVQQGYFPDNILTISDSLFDVTFSVFKDATKLWDIATYSLIQNNPLTITRDTTAKDIGDNPFAIALTDTSAHDYSIRLTRNSGTGTATLAFNDIEGFKLISVESTIT